MIFLFLIEICFHSHNNFLFIFQKIIFQKKEIHKKISC
jgi:hypothetical protein